MLGAAWRRPAVAPKGGNATVETVNATSVCTHVCTPLVLLILFDLT